MSETYSVLLQPSTEIVQSIAQLKNELKVLTGAFKAMDTPAHVTLNNFKAGLKNLAQWKEYVQYFTMEHTPITVNFNRALLFSNRALVLLPDEEGHALLNTFLQLYYQQIAQPFFAKPTKAHITLAQKLNDHQIAKALQMFANFQMIIHFDKMAIQHFNKTTALFEPYATFNLLHA